MGRRKRKSEKPPPSTALVVVPKKPQPHGGALYTGGVPGNRGGGRTPHAIKRLARKVLTERKLIERLGRIGSAEIGEIRHVWNATTKEVEAEYCQTLNRDQIRAIEVLAKIGSAMHEPRRGADNSGIKVFVLAETAAVHTDPH